MELLQRNASTDTSPLNLIMGINVGGKKKNLYRNTLEAVKYMILLQSTFLHPVHRYKDIIASQLVMRDPEENYSSPGTYPYSK